MKNESQQEFEIEIKSLQYLTEAIKNTYNIDFGEYAQSSFKRRISRIVQLYHFKSVEELAEKLKKDKEFFDLFLKEITVNTTEMFRDPTLWNYLRSELLPKFNESETIKIWHAACSSGEEVYSMAILLREMGLLDKAQIVASDINDKVLETAKNGIYTLRNVLEIHTSNYEKSNGNKKLSDYYTILPGERAQFDLSLIKGVTFKQFNLVGGSPFNKFDIILCRNVMIYFNQQLQDKCVSLFADSLFNHCYFIIGSKESITWCKSSEKFTLINQEEKVYKKIRD